MPAAFFFLEMINISKVERYHVCLKTSELLDPKLVSSKATDSNAKQRKNEDAIDKSLSKLNQLGTADVKLQILGSTTLDTSILSDKTIEVVDESESNHPRISFQNKSKVSLIQNHANLLNCPQVNQSLSKVPLECVVLKNLKASEDPMLPITDSYFSMPLFQILNEEMINFDSPDLPKDNLDFLCTRYSDDKYMDESELSTLERKEIQF